MREIVKVLCGSHLYGTDLEGSDKDYKSVFIPPAKDILLQRVQDAMPREGGAEDLELWSLQKFLRLLCEGQTVAMDLLFAPRELHQMTPHPEWLAIQENRSRFVSKNCRAFVGYCRQQASKHVVKQERMRAVDNAVQYFLSAVEKIANPGAVKIRELENLERFVAGNPFTELLSLETAHKTELKHLSICETMIPVTASVKLALATYERKAQEYGARARAAEQMDGSDWKSLYHAVRVAHEAMELMATGKLTFPRPEKDLLLEIRLGKLPLEAVQDMIEENLERVEKAVLVSSLPEKPDYAFADNLVEVFYRGAVLQP